MPIEELEEGDLENSQETTELAELLSLTQSDSETEVITTLQEAFPKLTEEAIEVLKLAVSGKGGFTSKERAQYAKFIVTEAIKIQSLTQTRKLEAIKTHIEATSRIASEGQMQQNMGNAASNVAMGAMNDMFRAINILGSGTPMKIAPAVQPEKEIVAKPPKKKKIRSSKKIVKPSEGKIILDIPESMKE